MIKGNDENVKRKNNDDGNEKKFEPEQTTISDGKMHIGNVNDLLNMNLGGFKLSDKARKKLRQIQIRKQQQVKGK